jgi:hypothetical protein
MAEALLDIKKVCNSDRGRDDRRDASDEAIAKHCNHDREWRKIGERRREKGSPPGEAKQNRRGNPGSDPNPNGRTVF